MMYSSKRLYCTDWARVDKLVDLKLRFVDGKAIEDYCLSFSVRVVVGQS
jgi:hypothetical protein